MLIRQLTELQLLTCSAFEDLGFPFLYIGYGDFISFFYCSPSGVQVVSPSRRWYRPPVVGIALPSLVSPSNTADN